MITRREVHETFMAQTGHFSTFGGNPVSCAAGLAVLEVLQREGLQENAARSGGYLKNGLWELAKKHDIIGDVRGSGLLVALELVRDRKTKAPAPKETSRVLDRLSELGVLTGRTGHLGNCLKIRPPLPFAPEHAEIFISALDQALSEL